MHNHLSLGEENNIATEEARYVASIQKYSLVL